MINAGLIDFVVDDSPAKTRACLALLVLIVLAAAGLLVWMGATVVLGFPWDVPILLDGGWRILQGQVPHVDFYTPLGPVTPLIVAFGMWLGGPVVSGFAYADAVLLIIISLWAWAIGRPRLSAVLSLLFALYAGFMAAGTAGYGYGLKQLSYAALYNRYGVALTAVLFIECFGRSRQNSPARLCWEGASTGIALGLLFFLKVNFFGIAVLAVMAGAILMTQSRYRWLGLCAGVGAVSLLMLAYLRFDIAAMLHDLRLAARVRSGGLVHEIPGLMQDPAVFNSAFLMAILWCVNPLTDNAYRRWLSAKTAQGLLVLFLIGMQAFLSLTNSQPRLPTLFPVAALLILSNSSGRSLATLLLGLYFVLSTLVPDIESLAYSAFLHVTQARELTADQKFDSTSLADMLVPTEPEYVQMVNDGCEMLRRHSQPSERILALDFSNPFSFALRRSPPKGDALWWDAAITFNKNVYPDPEKSFRDAALVMVPKKPFAKKTALQLMEVYGDYVRTRYTAVTESPFWILYRRRPT